MSCADGVFGVSSSPAQSAFPPPGRGGGNVKPGLLETLCWDWSWLCCYFSAWCPASSFTSLQLSVLCDTRKIWCPTMVPTGFVRKLRALIDCLCLVQRKPSINVSFLILPCPYTIGLWLETPAKYASPKW